MDLLGGVLEGAFDGVADRMVAGARHVPQDRRGGLHRCIGSDRQRRRRKVARQRRVVRGVAAVVAPADQEDRRELRDDRALDPAHDVVEALVVVVVLDAAAADVPDRSVDDDHLPMIEMEQILRVGLEPATAELTGSGDDDPVVRDDLDPGLAQLAEQRLAAEIDLAPDRIDGQPDLDALRHLGRQRLEERGPDVARLVAVDEQVDVILRGRDVLEDAREVTPAVEQGVDRGRDRGRECQREVGAADARSGDQLGRAGCRGLGADGVWVERVGGDPTLAAAQPGTDRGHRGTDRDRPFPAHGSTTCGVELRSICVGPSRVPPEGWQRPRSGMSAHLL